MENRAEPFVETLEHRRLAAFRCAKSERSCNGRGFCGSDTFGAAECGVVGQAIIDRWSDGWLSCQDGAERHRGDDDFVEEESARRPSPFAKPGTLYLSVTLARVMGLVEWEGVVHVLVTMANLHHLAKLLLFDLLGDALV